MTRKIAESMSDVEVTFMDGEVKTFRISASPNIGGFLAKQAGETGILTLYNREGSHGFPLTAIRNYSLRPVYLEQDGGLPPT